LKVVVSGLQAAVEKANSLLELHHSVGALATIFKTQNPGIMTFHLWFCGLEP